MTPALAQTLAFFAIQFYRGFPPKAVGLLDMASLAFHGHRRDIVTVAAVGLLGGLLAMALPIATGRMVDAVIPAAQANDAIALMLGLIAAIVASKDAVAPVGHTGLDVAGEVATEGGSSLADHDANIRQLADSLFSDYVFAFELTSVLLIVAVAGTVVLTRRDRPLRASAEREKVTT